MKRRDGSQVPELTKHDVIMTLDPRTAAKSACRQAGTRWQKEADVSTAEAALNRELVCPNYVGGQWKASSSGRTLERRNPADLGELIGYAQLSTREEVREAVAAAERAFPAWRQQPAPARGRILLKAARLFEERKEDLARLLTREEGKTLAESRGELVRAINTVEFIAGEARRLKGETLPSELPHNFAYTVRQPLGVVGLITPWNFPFAVPIWKLAPALVCGNTLCGSPPSLRPFVRATSRKCWPRRACLRESSTW